MFLHMDMNWCEYGQVATRAPMGGTVLHDVSGDGEKKTIFPTSNSIR